MAEDGAFREDLYYRRGFAAKMGIDVAGVSPQALAMMMTYHWPGNVRELENVIERAVILSESGLIEPGHLPPSLQTPVISELQRGAAGGRLLRHCGYRP